MTVRRWLLIGPLVLLLAVSSAPAAFGQSTPTGEAGLGTCLPEGGIPHKDSYLIGMSQANKGEPWRQAMNDQIAAAAAAHPELEVVFADAAQNNAKQVADVENFLQQGIDLLIISPNEAAPLTDVVAKVCAAGVPVIVLDRKVNGDQFTMWIGADNVEIGRRAGQYAANYCQEQNLAPCNIIEVRGLEGSTPAKERGDGFREGIAGNADATIIAQQNADWLREKAIPVSQAMFQANPDVNVVYAHNDPMAEAAIISAQNAGLNLDDMLFIGIDGLPTPDGGIRSVIDGRIDVTYVYPTGGAQAIDNAVQILEQGVTPPAEVVLETEEVRPDNAQQLLDKYTGGGAAATPAS
jgi:ribose transport system substrate-binding protein